VPLSDARRIAAGLRVAVAEGRDPVAERQAERGAGTFAELADRYVNEWAKRRNKSWAQADALVRKHLLPRWGKLAAKSITRSDVRGIFSRIEAPILANQVLAAASAIFSFGVKQEVINFNPVTGVERNPTQSRERVLSDAELALFWSAFGEIGMRGSALKVTLIIGQRPGEVLHMRREHIVDGWWNMPGEPDPKTGWPGTKNGASHRIWLPEAAREIIENLGRGGLNSGFVFGVDGVASAMRDICKKIKVERATPHDLRRTFSTTVTKLGFGRPAMDRITNHKDGGVGSVYDRYSYAEEDRRIMESVAAHIVGVAEQKSPRTNVVPMRTASN
jgi:integrase